MVVENYKTKDNKIFFKYNNIYYYLQEIEIDTKEDDIFKLYEFTLLLNYFNVFCHQLLKNKFGYFITEYNKKKYVLLKILNYNKDSIDINIINNLSHINLNYYFKKNNWSNLWSNKIDYLETLINENKNNNKTIYMNCDYAIGLAEIGISLYKNLKINIPNNIAHQRIFHNMEINEIMNPFNIIIDCIERDYAEYYKNLFFKSNNLDILEYIKKCNIKNIKLFFIRLLFITPFFDEIFEVIIKEKNEKNIYRYIEKLETYEFEIKKIYNILRKNNQIEYIQFLS